MMHKFGKLDFDSFQGWSKYSGGASCNQSKLAIMLLVEELADRLEGKDVRVRSLHPGAVNKGILDKYGKVAQFFLRRIFIYPEKGARTSTYLTEQDADALPTGKYFVNSKAEKPGKQLNDSALRTKLWDVSCSQLGIAPTI